MPATAGSMRESLYDYPEKTKLGVEEGRSCQDDERI